MANSYWELFLGYTAIWLIIAVFVMATVRRQGQLEQRLEELEKITGRTER